MNGAVICFSVVIGLVGGGLVWWINPDVMISQRREDIARNCFHPQVGTRPFGHMAIDTMLFQPRPVLAYGHFAR